MLHLSLILQYSQNWLVPNKPQEHVNNETDATLAQTKVKKIQKRNTI